MKVIKTITFFTFLPIIGLIYGFLWFVYGGHKGADLSQGKGWYNEVWDTGSMTEKMLAVLLAPIIFGLSFIMSLVFPVWEKLAE